MNVRLANQEESEEAVRWMAETPHNGFDPEVLGYDSTITFCAEQDKPIMYLPVQVTLTIESLGRNLGARKRDTVIALNEMLETIKKFALGAGIREVYFLSQEKGTMAQAAYFGFDRVLHDEEKDLSLFRMKVANGQTR